MRKNVARNAAVALSVSVLPFAAAQNGTANPLESLTAVLIAVIVYFVGGFFWRGFGSGD